MYLQSFCTHIGTFLSFSPFMSSLLPSSSLLPLSSSRILAEGLKKWKQALTSKKEPERGGGKGPLNTDLSLSVVSFFIYGFLFHLLPSLYFHTLFFHFLSFIYSQIISFIFTLFLLPPLSSPPLSPTVSRVKQSSEVCFVIICY